MWDIGTRVRVHQANLGRWCVMVEDGILWKIDGFTKMLYLDVEEFVVVTPQPQSGAWACVQGIISSSKDDDGDLERRFHFCKKTCQFIGINSREMVTKENTPKILLQGVSAWR